MVINRLKRFHLILLALVTFFSNAEEHNSHGQHKRIGYHGMVLIVDEHIGIFASHLPLYRRPHDYQIVYQISTSNDAKIKSLSKNKMVTVLPDAFDLNKLVEGQTFTIDAVLYEGHFERGGKKTDKIVIEFKKPIFIKQVNAENEFQLNKFNIVPLNSKWVMFIHEIQKAPSFDAIGFVKRSIENTNSGESQLLCKKPPHLKIKNINSSLQQCGFNQASYIETADFSR